MESRREAPQLGQSSTRPKLHPDRYVCTRSRTSNAWISFSSPFWPVRSVDFLASYATLAHSACAMEVVICGAGVSGALLADTTSATGYDVVVIDKRDVATGSTSAASTALCTIEIDVSCLRSWPGSAVKRTRRGLSGVRVACVEVDCRTRRVPRRRRCGFELSKASISRATKSCPVAPRWTRRRDSAPVSRVEFLTKPEIECASAFPLRPRFIPAGAAQIDPYRFSRCGCWRVPPVADAASSIARPR